MKKEFLVERQGKHFVLYAGLLDMAHQQGLRSIHTTLVQAPTKENSGVAIAVATVTLEKDGQTRSFTGIGDSAPNNVAPAMQTCLIRMAETRAKARALRDAVNVGVAAFEELGEEDAHDGAPERGYQVYGRSNRAERAAPAVRMSGPGRAQNGVGRSGKEATGAADEALNPMVARCTDDQANAVRNLCRRLSLEPDALVKERYAAAGLTELAQAQAGELIKSLSAQCSGRAA